MRLTLGFPLYLYGLVNNYLPYRIPSLVARRATKDVEFVAPIMLVVGMITFTLFYLCQTALVHHFTHNWRLDAALLAEPAALGLLCPQLRQQPR